MSRAGLIGRVLPALAAIAVLSLAAAGCGGAGTGSGGPSPSSSTTAGADTAPLTTSAIPPGQPVRGDGDADNPSDIDGNGDSDSEAVGGADADHDSATSASYAFPDRDDRATFDFGRSPPAAARRTIAGVLERYYAALSAGDGAKACGLLVPSVARAAPGDLGGTGGPSYLQGDRTCPAIVVGLSRHFRPELTQTIRVFEVRVAGAEAQIVFSSRSMPASSIFLRRRGDSWQVTVLMGMPLP